MEQKTAITLQMPIEAAERLKKKFEENPEEFKKYFNDLGFDILDLKIDKMRDTIFEG